MGETGGLVWLFRCCVDVDAQAEMWQTETVSLLCEEEPRLIPNLIIKQRDEGIRVQFSTLTYCKITVVWLYIPLRASNGNAAHF